MLRLSKTIRLTKEFTLKPNLTDLVPAEDLQALGEHVWEGYQRDKQSRVKWERRTDAAMNLALQITSSKSFPWPNASNIAFPLVTIAALQFHSQAFPALLQGPDLVKYRSSGNDPTGEAKARGDRISAHMSYQVGYEDRAWEEQHDRLLLALPIIGSAFIKTFHKPSEFTNKSELVLAHDLVMDYYAKSVETAVRKTHVIPVYRNDMYESCMSGVFRNVLKDAWYEQNATIPTSQHQTQEDARTGKTAPVPQSDEDTPFRTLEQHCWLDLDGDGYREPYIATIEESSHTLLRLVTRFEWGGVDRLSDGRVIKIRPTEYFTGYHFIPSPDGSAYGLGFGVLLGPLNEATNTIINQLTDAGTMSNSAGGFLTRGAKMRGGQYTFAPLEWKTVDVAGDDLKKSVFPLPVREPSTVLFQLLNLLITFTGRISGTTETQVGENPGQNTPAGTTQTLVEQGMKIYKAIFKRVWSSMQEELAKLYILNALNMSPEPVTFGDGKVTVQRRDYLVAPPYNIMPAADPNVVSELMRHQIATMVKQAAMTTPGYDHEQVERQWLKTLHVDGIDIIYPGIKKTGPLPNPKIQIEQMKSEIAQQKIKFEQMKFVVQLQTQEKLNQAKIVELMAKATLEIEQAGGVRAGHQIAAFEAAIGALKTHNDILTQQAETMLKGMEYDAARQDAGGGGVRGVAGESDNADSSQAPASPMG
jgi:chaperonin GroES